MRRVVLTVLGQPVSKANSRQLVHTKRRREDGSIERVPLFIKSKEALAYEKAVAKQVVPIDPLFEGEVRVVAHVWYKTNRPDLDVSLLLDALQGRVYKNDRQVRSLAVEHYIDRDNPRALVIVEERRK